MPDKIIIYPEFTIEEMESALSPFMSSRTHSRNIAYSLQFLKYCEELIKQKIEVKFAIDSIFSKAMTVIASSVIECLIFDSLKKNDCCLEKWKDFQPPTELPIYKDDPNRRVRIVYQEKIEEPLDKFVPFGMAINLAIENQIIDSGIRSSLDKVKSARDLIHIRGGEDLDMKKINLDFYFKITRPTLIKIMEKLKLKKAIELFELSKASESKPKEIVKKPYYKGASMVWSVSNKKWYLVKKEGGLVDFLGEEKDIEWRIVK
ncbi:MAG: hypothetical protein WCX77_01190 [Candidatus Paceibacterota bacterium]|jgi:hypothetical protein